MQMKEKVMLTMTSLLSILFFTFHVADDIVRGFEKGDASNSLIALGVTALFSLILASRGLFAAIKGADGRMTAVENESPDRRR